MTDWTIDRVKDRLELAAEVMRQAPGVKPQGYFSQGNRMRFRR